ncbi:MAG: AsmA family protein [Sideroxyarcus sp.]
MNKYLKYSLWTIGGVMGLFAGVIAYIALTFDPNDYKPQIIQAVKDSKQRTLKLDGDIKLYFFPSIGVSLSKVSLSEFQSEREFVSVDSASVSLKLLPLLTKQLVVDAVAVSGVKAQLVKFKNGKTSIDDLVGKEEAPAEPASVAESGAPMKFDIASVRLDKTDLSYSDEATGARYSVKGLMLQTGRIASGIQTRIDFAARIQSGKPKLDISAQIKTTLTFDLEKNQYQVQGLDLQANGAALDITNLVVKASGDASARPATQEFSMNKFALTASGVKGKDKFDARLDAPDLNLTKDKFTGENISLNAKLDGALGNVAAKLALPAIEGNAQVFKVSSLQLDVDLKQPEQSFKVKLTTPVTGSIEAQQFNMSDIKLALNATGEKLPGKSINSELKGKAQADLSRQNIEINLAGGLLQSQIKAAVAVKNFTVPAIRYDLEIDQFDADPYMPKQAAAQETNKKAEPEQPFDLSALKKLNLEGSLRVGSLKAANVKVAQLRVDVKAKNGTVNISPFSAKLYQGSMDSKITVNAVKAQPEFAVQTALAGVEVGQLLTDAMKMDFLDGKGNVALNVTTQGNLVSLLKKNLNGKMSVALADGAVKGINLAKTVREFGKGGGDKTQAANKEEKTDFSELNASFKITNGVAHNDDLSLKSPFIRVGGKGDINLGKDSLDYLVKATIAGTMEGQGGKDNVGGVTVPVRLSGPFTALKYKLEFGSMVSEKAKQKAQAVTQKAKEDAKAKARDELKKGLKGLFK